jgi:steroid delta-isomerase
MITFEQAKQACTTYIQALEAGDVEAVLGLFAESATVEDPVGTELKAGKAALRPFYEVACQSVTAAQFTGEPKFAGGELAFPFIITIGSGEGAVTIDIIDIFKFDEAGKVVSMRAFWGPENMAPVSG